VTTQTLAAVLTPPGSAAIATIAIVGPNAWSIARSAFQTVLPDEPDPTRHWFGQFGEAQGDQVVLTVRHARSPLWIEIHSHGGPQVVQWLLREMQDRGAAVASWQELLHLLPSSEIRLSALSRLSQAVTVRTAGILLDQYHGALEADLITILDELGDGKLESARHRLAALLQFAPLGQRLTYPWRVALAGPPNVGKSSLINRLVGFPRCIVTPIAGTTRDVVATSIAIDGWPVELIDTAGQRESLDAIEQAGIAAANEVMQTVDLVMWVTEATAIADSSPNQSALCVRNKIDLSPDRRDDDIICVSALTGEGLDDLLLALSRRLVPAAPMPGSGVPFSARIIDELDRAANLLLESNVLGAREKVAALLGLTGSSIPP
jgi:tRNA modification GTPase